MAKHKRHCARKTQTRAAHRDINITDTDLHIYKLRGGRQHFMSRLRKNSRQKEKRATGHIHEVGVTVTHNIDSKEREPLDLALARQWAQGLVDPHPRARAIRFGFGSLMGSKGSRISMCHALCILRQCHVLGLRLFCPNYGASIAPRLVLVLVFQK